jgi:hypothetical protein
MTVMRESTNEILNPFVFERSFIRRDQNTNDIRWNPIAARKKYANTTGREMNMI